MGETGALDAMRAAVNSLKTLVASFHSNAPKGGNKGGWFSALIGGGDELTDKQRKLMALARSVRGSVGDGGSRSNKGPLGEEALEKNLKDNPESIRTELRRVQRYLNVRNNAGAADHVDKGALEKLNQFFEGDKETTFDTASRKFAKQEIELENLRSAAVAYHASISNIDYTLQEVKDHGLGPTGADLGSVARSAFPGDPKGRGEFNEKLHALETAGNKEGVITLLQERQLQIKAESGKHDKAAEDSRERMIKNYDAELAANERAIKVKTDAAEEPGDLDQKESEPTAARQRLVDLKGKFTDTDEEGGEGVRPSGHKEVIQGRMRGVEQVFGALPTEHYEVDRIKREKALIAEQVEALKGLMLSDAEKAEMASELRIKRRENEGRELYAGIQDKVFLGGRRAENVMAGAAVGRNEPQMQRSEIRAAEAAAAQSAVLARMDTDRSVTLGRVAEVETYINTLKEMQISNTSRMYRVEAEITNEKRKQNEEAAKALLMASREEQLRAALTKRAVDRRGGRGFSANEFQFLSTDMRQNVERYNPSALPPEYMNHLRELQREKGQAGALNAELPGAIARLNATLEKMPQFQLAGDKGGDGTAMPDWMKMPASFHFSFGDQFKEMTGALLEGVKRPLQNELNAIRGMVFSLLGDQGLGEAQQAGHL